MKMLLLATSLLGSAGNESPIVCNLKALTPAERTEHAVLGARFRSAIVRTDDLSAGYRFHLSGDVSVSDVARWVELEHRCCPFLDIALEVEREGGSAWIELSGRSGVKAFIRAEMAPTEIVPAAQPEPAARRGLGAALDGWIANAESKVVAVADAMPAERYAFAPTDGEFHGVRTFAEQLKHVAAANDLIAAAILGTPPPADAGDETGPAPLTTKADIVAYLKRSFADFHKAVAAIDDRAALAPIGGRKPPTDTRLGLVADAIDHAANHYGQLVEYLRMNGIVPPASR